MTTLRAKVPPSLYKQVEELADQEKISIDELVGLALSAQVSAWLTRETMEVRGKRGSWKKFDRVMPKIRDIDPAKNDQR